MTARTARRSAIIFAVLVIALAIAPVANAAILTLPFTRLAGGAVTVNFDFNTGNGNVLRFRCINGTELNAWMGVYLYDPDAQTETLVGERICPGLGTIEQNIPGVTIAWNEADQSIEMGNYIFRASWPAP